MMKVLEYDPQKPRYGPRLTNEEWERFRPILTELNNQGLPRHEIVTRARDEYGFRGTYSALNTRLKAWGLTNSDSDPITQPQDMPPDTVETQPSREDETSVEARASSQPENSEAEYSELRQHSSSETINPPLAEDKSTHSVQPQRSDIVSEPADTQLPSLTITPANHGDSSVNASSAVGNITVSLAQEPGDIVAVETSVPNYSDTLTQIKRTRSEVSSLRSSKFSVSSSAKSFMQLAKRLRLNPARISVTSLMSQLSKASSHASQDFGIISGLHPAMPVIPERSFDIDPPGLTPSLPENLLQNPNGEAQVKWLNLENSPIPRTILLFGYAEGPALELLEQMKSSFKEEVELNHLSEKFFPFNTPSERERYRNQYILNAALSFEAGTVHYFEFLRYSDLNESTRGFIEFHVGVYLKRMRMSYSIDDEKNLLYVSKSENRSKRYKFYGELPSGKGVVQYPHRQCFQMPCLYIHVSDRPPFESYDFAFRLDPTVLKVWPTALQRNPTAEEQEIFDKSSLWPTLPASILSTHPVSGLQVSSPKTFH